MDRIIDFTYDFINSFANAGNWFFNTTLDLGALGSYPIYSIVLFGGLVTILSLHLIKLLIP